MRISGVYPMFVMGVGGFTGLLGNPVHFPRLPRMRFSGNEEKFRYSMGIIFALGRWAATYYPADISAETRTRYIAWPNPYLLGRGLFPGRNFTGELQPLFRYTRGRGCFRYGQRFDFIFAQRCLLMGYLDFVPNRSKC